MYILFRKAGINPFWLGITSLPLIIMFVFKAEVMTLTMIEIVLLASITNICLPFLALRAWVNIGEEPNPFFFNDTQNLFLILVHVLIPLFSLFVVLRKLGFNGYWCLLGLFPPSIIAILWYGAIKSKATA